MLKLYPCNGITLELPVFEAECVRVFDRGCCLDRRSWLPPTPCPEAEEKMGNKHEKTFEKHQKTSENIKKTSKHTKKTRKCTTNKNNIMKH